MSYRNRVSEPNDEYDYMERNVWAEADMASAGDVNDDHGDFPLTQRRNSNNEELDMTQHCEISDSGLSPNSIHSEITLEQRLDKTLNIEEQELGSDTDAKIDGPDDDEEKEEPEKVLVPPLIDLVPEMDRISLAALVFLALHELSYRYCQYEFLREQRVVEAEIAAAAQTSKGRNKSILDRLRKKSIEETSLLGNFSDDDDSLLPPPLPKYKSTGALQSLNGSNKSAPTIKSVSADTILVHGSSQKDKGKDFSNPHNHRIPFQEEMNNPETIQDSIFFNRELTGNMMLSFAFKSFQQLSFSIMDQIYTQLHIEHQERLFIEQGITLGLTAGNIVTSLSFLSTKDISLAESNPNSKRLRFILCNILICIMACSDGKYGSMSRTVFKRICDHLQVDWIDSMEFIETPFLDSLSPSDTEPEEMSYLRKIALKERDKMIAAQTRKKRRKRIVYMTAAAVGGGALIGITTGLAAPIVGAGIGAALAALKVAGATTFFGSVGGTALITGGGILTGTSIGGRTMEKRTRDLEYFKFVPIHTEGHNITICISGWLITRNGKGKELPKRNRSQTESSNFSKKSDAASVESSSSTVQLRKAETNPSLTEEEFSTIDTLDKDSSIDLPEDILATGFQDLITPFMGISPVNGQLHSLLFDPHILRTLGDALKMLASEVISFSANQILAQTILSTLMAGLTWPMWLVKLGYLVDNPWSLGLDRAKKAGRLLADKLKDQNKSVTLIGFSLGARAIFYCLLELAKEGRYGLVQDVFLFGTPILIPANAEAMKLPTSMSIKEKFKEYVIDPSKEDESSPNRNHDLEEWRLAMSIVSGRLVNAYSRSDWVLGFLFRASVAGIWDVAGMRPVLLDSSLDVRTVDDYYNGIYCPGLSVIKKAHIEKLKRDSNMKDAEEMELKDVPVSEEDVVKLRSYAPCTIIENIDITSQIDGHLSYRTAMPSLVKQICGYSTWSEDLEVIDEMFGGEWLESLDGWWKEKKGKKKSGIRKRAWSNLSAGSSSTSIHQTKKEETK